ncbi:hypothetical protein Dsin_010260 [Dipteronia sinensis]|uniref:Uncharacterized protein n=1 Tax=Dipteronia sinensis TaxID=43782 RepID=A0AAE0ASV6_9ROSI|nr:hypothetical protein Dsin_010248 [Dipteronia sinensis]KAK3223235.1 hypothetical protein Dsin_010260 [Dipteronia sinensis]
MKKKQLCQRVLKNFEASTSWIVRKLGDKIRRNPGIPIDMLENELRTKYQMEVHRHRLYRAKQAALGSLKEDHARCYGMMRQSINLWDHNEAMTAIKKLDVKAFQWFSDIDTKVWCAHAWDIEVKCDHATNNLSEAFNSWIGKLRNQPVLTLLENL